MTADCCKLASISFNLQATKKKKKNHVPWAASADRPNSCVDKVGTYVGNVAFRLVFHGNVSIEFVDRWQDDACSREFQFVLQFTVICVSACCCARIAIKIN